MLTMSQSQPAQQFQFIQGFLPNKNMRVFFIKKNEKSLPLTKYIPHLK